MSAHCVVRLERPVEGLFCFEAYFLRIEKVLARESYSSSNGEPSFVR